MYRFIGYVAIVLVAAFPARAENRNSDANVTIAARVKPNPEPVPEGAPRPDLRVDVPLVLVPVHVTTPIGASVTSLGRDNFRLLEDDVEQKLTTFAIEDAPVSIGLLFDLSGSMSDKIEESRAAAIEFLKSINPEDEFFLVAFNNRPHLAAPFTRDPSAIESALYAEKPHGQTSLFDAIHLALSEMKSAHHSRKALVIFSDGGDNHSRIHRRAIKDEMMEGDSQVYSIGIFEPEGVHLRTREEQNGPRLLTELSSETGGMYFAVRKLQDLMSVCRRISDELRSQYVLGYSPANAERDGKYRRLKIVLNPPPDMPALRVWSRGGYHAPLN